MENMDNITNTYINMIKNPDIVPVITVSNKNGYNIILTTGRKESLRSITETQLSEVGIFYDKLIIGIGGGKRVLINDTKPDDSLTAECYNLKRNSGIKNLDI